MKSFSPFYGIMFLLILNASCEVPPLIAIFNHSGKDLIVHADKNTYQIRSNATGEVQYPGNEQILRIDDGSEVLRYKTHYPPKDYMSGSGFRMHVINCQIEQSYAAAAYQLSVRAYWEELRQNRSKGQTRGLEKYRQKSLR